MPETLEAEPPTKNRPSGPVDDLCAACGHQRDRHGDYWGTPEEGCIGNAGLCECEGFE